MLANSLNVGIFLALSIISAQAVADFKRNYKKNFIQLTQ